MSSPSSLLLLLLLSSAAARHPSRGMLEIAKNENENELGIRGYRDTVQAKPSESCAFGAEQSRESRDTLVKPQSRCRCGAQMRGARREHKSSGSTGSTAGESRGGVESRGRTVASSHSSSSYGSAPRLDQTRRSARARSPADRCSRCRCVHDRFDTNPS